MALGCENMVEGELLLTAVEYFVVGSISVDGVVVGRFDSDHNFDALL